MLLSLVVGEEETGDGTQALLQEHTFDWAVVAEATNMPPCLRLLVDDRIKQPETRLDLRTSRN